MKNEIYAKVLAGKYKGKKLLLPSLEVTRSSKSILKESYFNTLQFDIVDANFVEVFAGSGSIGLEALSRDAKKIYFMEKDDNSFKVLKQNIQSLDASKCQAHHGDSFKLISLITQELQNKNETAYFFIDPPFSYREGQEKIYDDMLVMIENIPTKLVEMITIEHMTQLKLPDTIGPYTKKKTKKFGKSSLTHYIF